MRTRDAVTIHRLDYAPPAWRIERTELHFDLAPEATRVHSTLELVADPASVGLPEPTAPLVLDGVELELESIRLNGAELAESEYTIDACSLTIPAAPARCRLETVVVINPDANTALEGLYRSSGTFCTQCEAEGFRKITWYLDRPDVLSVFDVTIEADRVLAPVLLSNGNLVSVESLDDDRHRARWHDPHPKPAYLFALVAGDLVEIEDSFKTASGRNVRLSIFVESHNARRCDFAMASLRHSMSWDERVYGFEYDLDRFMIVAVDDFNMGAMENKGLNVFNSKFVLADAGTATDTDYLWIESVIAHEYFHNWTGNRVTCRDWFQLSLKEGLTVFRDQSFTADRHSGTVKRIDDVRRLRASQFPEDTGPLAHPIRPDSYIEINNFYTTTVYEKGAEVIRMLHTLVGIGKWRECIDLYIERHDGTAATCEDFVCAIEAASGLDLRQFRLWYSLAGTPVLECQERWDGASGRYSLAVRQHCPDTPGQKDKPPMHIPLAFGLLDADGRDIPFPNGQGTRVHELTAREETIVVEDLAHRPVASLLRGFSAPVKIERTIDPETLAFLAAHDSDGFNRWEAGQQLAQRAVAAHLDAGSDLQALTDALADGIGHALADQAIDPALRAAVLSLPGVDTFAETRDEIDIGAIDTARQSILRSLALVHREALTDLVTRGRTDVTAAPHAGFGGRAPAERALANSALALLASLDQRDWVPLAEAQFTAATNMTDRVAALGLMCHTSSPARERCLDHFRARFCGDALVIDKWLALQAASRRDDTAVAVRRLAVGEMFDADNPNRVRALIGTFANANPLRFHDPSGAGYRLVGEHVARLDATNPQVAARLVSPLARWRRFVPAQGSLMRAELERLLVEGVSSPDVVELVTKSLAGTGGSSVSS